MKGRKEDRTLPGIDRTPGGPGSDKNQNFKPVDTICSKERFDVGPTLDIVVPSVDISKALKAADSLAHSRFFDPHPLPHPAIKYRMIERDCKNKSSLTDLKRQQMA